MSRTLQAERFLVERWKCVGRGRWAWVIVGSFNAIDAEDARKQARSAIAQRLCILRACPVGAPEGVRV